MAPWGLRDQLPATRSLSSLTLLYIHPFPQIVLQAFTSPFHR